MSNDSGLSSLQHWLRLLLGAPRERDGATQKLCPAFSLGTGHSLLRSVPAVSRCKALITSPSGQLRDRATTPTFLSLLLLLLNNNNNNNSSSRAGAEESWCMPSQRLVATFSSSSVPLVSKSLVENNLSRDTARAGTGQHLFSADITPWWRIGYGAPKSCVPCARAVSRPTQTPTTRTSSQTPTHSGWNRRNFGISSPAFWITTKNTSRQPPKISSTP